VLWCSHNKMELKMLKMVEMLMDFRPSSGCTFFGS